MLWIMSSGLSRSPDYRGSTVCLTLFFLAQWRWWGNSIDHYNTIMTLNFRLDISCIFVDLSRSKCVNNFARICDILIAHTLTAHRAPSDHASNVVTSVTVISITIQLIKNCKYEIFTIIYKYNILCIA